MRYPLIELCGMGIFIFAFETYPSIFDAVCVVGILSMFMVLAYTDIKEQKVSTRQSLIIMLCGIIFNRYDILNSILGGLIGGCLIIILTNLGLKFFNKKTFGVGDIYLMGAIGAVVGIDRLLLHIAYILVLQLIYVLPNYIMTLWRNEQSETLKYLIYFIPTCLFFYVFKNAEFFGSNVLSALFLIPLLFLAYKLSKNIVGILKTQETQSYCPLAPAIAISCLMYLL
jgi:Flp pilus assembly protein protease CpaA